ncbi:MAG: indole-3-glycerol phosphate synthase TrpC [Magnetococcales bacterium]|nr:indole-3-glycerol phosphate synthase TrpC [Magnetococcales bacterium]NGZ06084.1 indole-3-glycerol phosphate synthase TrpC [Magnetococcales bacterium]
MPMAATILDRIMARKREEVAAARRACSVSDLYRQCRDLPPTRGFFAAMCHVTGRRQPAIIAEVKQGSPSKGRILPQDVTFDPGWIAEGYARHGATCISCLTDKDFFMGAGEYVEQIRARMPLPVLRKDFLADPYQVVESRTLGADAILLIMAVLELPLAQELEAAALELGLDVLVEVHDAAELEAAHRLQTPLLGINNRNLKTFVTDLDTTFRLARLADPERLLVSESGIRTAEDLQRLMDQGVYSALIGESFMKERDPGAALGKMLEGCSAAV